MTALLSPEFMEFYLSYPRRVARGGALRAYNAAINKGATHAEIMEGLLRYRFSVDMHFIPYPATWLNQERWLDEQEHIAPDSMRYRNGFIELAKRDREAEMHKMDNPFLRVVGGRDVK